MTKVKRVQRQKLKVPSKIDQDKYRVRLKDDNWIRPYCTIPGEYKRFFVKVTTIISVRGRWDRRAKLECKTFGVTPSRFYYHARNINNDDMFIDHPDKTANDGWGLFPSKDALNTAWEELDDYHKEYIAMKHIEFEVIK